MDLMMEHLQQGIVLSLMLSLPAVLLAAGIGLVVGILQAVTQVQEQTIAAAPKILGVFILLLLGGGLMLTMMTNYLRESVQIAFNEIPMDGDFILPPKAGQTPGHARARQFFQMQASPDSEDKLKQFAAQWTAPTDGSASTLTLTAPKPKPGSSLGIAEKMMLEKGKR